MSHMKQGHIEDMSEIHATINCEGIRFQVKRTDLTPSPFGGFTVRPDAHIEYIFPPDEPPIPPTAAYVPNEVLNRISTATLVRDVQETFKSIGKPQA